MEGQTNINTCRVSELNKLNINAYVCKFVAKLIKYMLLFKNILTFIGLGYSDASLITLYLVVIGISIKKIR